MASHGEVRLDVGANHLRTVGRFRAFLRGAADLDLRSHGLTDCTAKRRHTASRETCSCSVRTTISSAAPASIALTRQRIQTASSRPAGSPNLDARTPDVASTSCAGTDMMWQSMLIAIVAPLDCAPGQIRS